MSSRDIHRRGLLTGGALLLLSGCGFRPVYGRETGTGGGALFGAVVVESPPGELGFRLREALIRRLGAPRANAPLTLVVSPEVETDGLAITQSDAVTRYNLTMTADFTLKRGAARLYRDLVDLVAAFNATASQYATLVSEREVEARAASNIADKIVKRLGAHYDPAWLNE